MNLENFIYGLIFAVVIVAVAWRLGIRRRAWREALAYTGLAIALYLALRVSGIFDPSTAVFVAFVAAAIMEWLLMRFARRPA